MRRSRPAGHALHQHCVSHVLTVMETEQRESFTNKTGFILASVGAAIGVGNLWMFPWRLGQYGGAAFLIPYLICVYVLGTTGLMGEFALGRWARKGAMGAYDKLLRTRGFYAGRIIGAYPVLTVFAVLTFYTIVAGWILRYFFSSVSGSYLQAQSQDAHFQSLAGQPISILWQCLVILMVGGVLLLGIAKGLERASRMLMPLLLGLFLILAIRSLTLPGAIQGINYLLRPQWDLLLQPITWAMALGQAFFSVSLTGASMLVYGSYLKRDVDIPRAALYTATLDTVAAILAAVVIIPAAFAYGITPDAGPPLLFLTMPRIFASMPGGQIFGALFFLGAFFAAFTTLLCLTEVLVEAGTDQFRRSRRAVIILVTAATVAWGLPLAVDFGRFEQFVDMVTVYFNPLAAVIVGILFYWVYPMDKARAEINAGAARPLGRWWNPLAKYLFVGVSILVVVLQFTHRIG